MAKDLNRWEGIGRLGNDPEVRYLPNGNAVASLSVACGDDYKNKDGEKVERTEWVRLSAFGKLAEIIGQYVKKGSRIYAEGKFTTRSWDDDKGVKHYSTEILLSNMQMLDSKPQDDQLTQSGSQQQRPSTSGQQSQHHTQKANGYQPQKTLAINQYNEAPYDDDIPFNSLNYMIKSHLI